MKSLSRRFGRVVRRLREEAGYSQERFAALAKLDRTYYSRIERGLANVSIEVCHRIARTLGLTLGELCAELERNSERS